MKGSREGMAGIFDAFVFLAIASLVSVSLLAAVDGPSPEEGEQQQRIEDSLTVLLRATVRDGDGNARSLQEVYLSRSGTQDSIDDEITMTLGMLLPGWEWRWSVHRSGNEVAAVATSEIVPEGTVYCSTAQSTLLGEVVKYRLEAWLP